MGLVPAPVAGLLRWGSVIPETVGLDHEAQLGPEEVDPEPVDLSTCLRGREPGRPDQLKESALELGVRQAKNPAIKNTGEGTDPMLASHLFKRFAQPLRIDEIEPVGFVDCCFQLRFV
jgi:hypothetical protein